MSDSAEELQQRMDAGYAHVASMLPSADGESLGPFWYGWALRGAFVAGAAWQAARRAVPDAPGWKLVPLEPTEDMLFAAEMSNPRGYEALYRAMLAASPALPPLPQEPTK